MSSSNSENSRSSAEVEHLNMLEAIVRRGLDADLEVGNALAEINDTWLYRATHETFEAYVRDRWGISRTLAQELIQAAEAAAQPPAGVDGPAPTMTSHAGPLAPVRRDGTDRLAKVWEKARQAFGSEDVTAVEIHLTVHKRQQPPPLTPSPWPSLQAPNESRADEPLRRLRWLMAEASGTIANIAHQLETHASKLDEYASEQLLDDVLVLDEDLAVLKTLLPVPVDWDAAHGRLIAGELAPFEDESDEEDEDD
ncbi:MAG TPA: hypothetical protein VGG07_24040 [Solirubrobacteraceae bacterium]|jgi:hypothetical protein